VCSAIASPRLDITSELLGLIRGAERTRHVVLPRISQWPA
jgi:hypothetical protein